MSQKEEARYRAEQAQHAMQAAIGIELTTALQKSDVAGVHPFSEAARQMKHLRVGVNSALGEIGAIGRLLIGKGVVTEQEYLDAIAEAMEDEAERAAAIARAAANLPEGTTFG